MVSCFHLDLRYEKLLSSFFWQISVTQKSFWFEGLGQRLCGISCIATADVCETTGFVAYRADTWMRFGNSIWGFWGWWGCNFSNIFLKDQSEYFQGGHLILSGF